MDKQQKKFNSTTIVISIISLIIIVAQGIYAGYFNKRWKEIEFLDSKKKELKDELEKQSEIPQIAVEIDAIEKKNLSTEILKSIDKSPITIQIQHSGGNQLKNIDFIVSTSNEILDVEPWESVNEFQFVIADNRKSLNIHFDKLKYSSFIGLTLITNDISNVKYEIYSDSKFSEYNIEELEREKFLKDQINSIETEVSKIRNLSFWKWATEKVTFLLFPLVLLIWFASIISIGLIQEYLRNFMYYSKKLNDVKTNPDNYSDFTNIYKELKKPQELKILDDQTVELWYYYVYLAGVFTLKKGLTFRISSSGTSVIDSNGDTINLTQNSKDL